MGSSRSGSSKQRQPVKHGFADDLLSTVDFKNAIVKNSQSSNYTSLDLTLRHFCKYHVMDEHHKKLGWSSLRLILYAALTSPTWL